jgi:hypothetical protein
MKAACSFASFRDEHIWPDTSRAESSPTKSKKNLRIVSENGRPEVIVPGLSRPLRIVFGDNWKRSSDMSAHRVGIDKISNKTHERLMFGSVSDK